MLKFKKLFWIGSMLAAVPGILPISARAESLQEYIEIALRENPGLEAAELRVLAAERTIPQSTAFPEPRLTLGLMNLPVNSYTLDQEPMTGKTITVQQMFPFPGKRQLAGKMAEQSVAEESYRRDEMRNQVIARVEKTFYDLYAVDRAIETVDANRSLMQQFVQVAETRYATGSGLQQDVLRAQVELSNLQDDVLMWKQKRTAVVAHLNALLNRNSDSPFAPTGHELALPDFSPPVNRLEETRPLLRAWREILGRAETAVELAKKAYYPDITLGVGYTQRDDLQNGAIMHDFFSATVSANLPLWFGSRQKPQVKKDEYSAASLRAEYLDLLNQVRADSLSTTAEIERNQKRIQLYEKSILQQSRQALESALAGYRVDKVDFLTLINSWTMVKNTEMQYYRSLADYAQSIVDFKLITGIISTS